MKLWIKTGAVLLLLALLTLPAFGQFEDITKLQDSLGDLSEILGETLTSNAALGLTWSDAYIGQLLSAPPHLGVGISAGATFVKLDKFDDIFDAFGIDSKSITDRLGSFGYLPVPTAGAEVRIGGIVLPFDVGLKALPLPQIDISGTPYSVKYTMFGADVRYALLKDNGILPGLSVSFGYSYLDMGLEAAFETTRTIPLGSLTGFSSTDELTISNTKLGFNVRNNTFDLKAQLSKRIFFITPYIGAGVSYGISTVGYNIDGGITDNVSGKSLDDIAKAAGLDGISTTGIRSSTAYKGFNYRAFGGLSFNLAVIRLDLTGVYNFNGNFGANLGLRFQL
jgi:hypothetical protein